MLSIEGIVFTISIVIMVAKLKKTFNSYESKAMECGLDRILIRTKRHFMLNIATCIDNSMNWSTLQNSTKL